ncbi:hydroxyacid dehydrogenase [Arthrobacter sp. EH-1B-1]|uniref:Hydroxyacid dehydrogenase n=1 Tax=Arthrobacter vasquezii TaxID=2977629 RepID=A0ABT6CX41_9MICC|nr:hydroxyacid dehydrogenase [Arthrobacter vasquezii]MDF9277604.1 hydroxyacid dehydrogenase [Arthrobacter vasquezii]
MTAVVYVSDPIHPDVLNKVQSICTLRFGFGLSKVNYLDVADTVDAVILRGETFTSEMIARSPRLKIIARHGVGTDNVDLQAASEHGVWVTSTPGANSNAVAEHVFALLFSSARKLSSAQRAVVAGKWSEDKENLIGFELSGRTLGLIGFGSIGRRVAQMAVGLSMKVLVFDPYASAVDVEAAGAASVELDDLLRVCDVVSLHLPLLASTRHLLGRDQIALMKPSALVINTSRGGLIDEDALLAALDSGAIAGAALDVLEAENVDMRNPLPHSTLAAAEREGLTVTPHIAGQTIEAFLEAGNLAWESVQDVLSGRPPKRTVNARVLQPAHMPS